MLNSEMLKRIEHGHGFIAALDQSGGSTPKALKGYGIDADAYSDDAEMFALIHRMRSRIVTSPCFTGDKVLGAILFERTMDAEIGGLPTPEVLKARGIVPFIKIDRGLEPETDGVQLMKPLPDLDALLARAKTLGVFGTKARSVINLANRHGIAAIVQQQFDVAGRVLAAGLVPIVEPEINTRSVERDAADQLLLVELTRALDGLPGDERVILKLSLPQEPHRFASLVDHPRCLRLVALSGGFGRAEACAELAANRGVIASFCRALIEDLRYQMTPQEFDAALGEAIDEIYRASTDKGQ